MRAPLLSSPRRLFLRSRCQLSLARCALGVAYWRWFERALGSSRKNALSASRARLKSRERLAFLAQRQDDARAALGLLNQSQSPFFHL